MAQIENKQEFRIKKGNLNMERVKEVPRYEINKYKKFNIKTLQKNIKIKI